MGSLGIYVLLAIVYVVLYRAFGFIRRCKAKHRASLLQLGYVERNKPYRLRSERRFRFASIAYVAISASLIVFFPGIIFSRGANVFGIMLFSLILGFFPSVVFLWGLMFFEESMIFGGALFLTMRDNQWKKVGKPLDVSQGSLGSATLLNPASSLITNPFALIAMPHQEVSEEEKVAA